MQRRGPTTPPRPESRRFGLFPGRSPLLGESLLFSLPQGTKMFQFPRFASSHKEDGSPSDCRVAPFGNPGINDRLRLPRAFRSLPRPSSPSRATGIRRAPFLAFCRCPRALGAEAAYLRSGACPIPTLTADHAAEEGGGLRPSLVSLFCSIMSMSKSLHQGYVENNGFEPLTPCLQSRCSSQLS